jgi:hypothetical protein
MDDDFYQTFKPSLGEKPLLYAMNVEYESAAGTESGDVNKPSAPVASSPNTQTSGAGGSLPRNHYISATQTGTNSESPHSPSQVTKKSNKPSSNCTPSPTTSMAPSASKSSLLTHANRPVKFLIFFFFFVSLDYVPIHFKGW